MKGKETHQAEALENFEFISGPLPNDYKLDYDVALFNTAAHQTTQSENGWNSFHLLRKDKKKVLASITFCILDKKASSPLKAPFGGFEISKSVTTNQLFHFVAFFEKKLKEKYVNKILIKCAPEQYQSKQHNISSVIFFNHHYRVSLAELGACLKVNEIPFIDKIDPWEKRKLKQAVKADLDFKVISLRHIESVYEFILCCRAEREQSLSMTFKELNKTVDNLKPHFVCFGVYHEKKMVAASISIKVNKSVVYNFYSAHSKASDALSPVVFLLDGIYAWCKLHRFSLLDLGTSAWSGKPNFSLIDFKLRLGATPTMKLAFEKEI